MRTRTRPGSPPFPGPATIDGPVLVAGEGVVPDQFLGLPVKDLEVELAVVQGRRPVRAEGDFDLAELATSTAATRLPSIVKQASAPLPAKAQTCLPSVEQEAEASDTSAPPGFGYRFAPVPDSFSFHFSWPSVPTQRTHVRAVHRGRKIRSPHTTGVRPRSPAS